MKLPFLNVNTITTSHILEHKDQKEGSIKQNCENPLIKVLVENTRMLTSYQNSINHSITSSSVT